VEFFFPSSQLELSHRFFEPRSMSNSVFLGPMNKTRGGSSFSMNRLPFAFLLNATLFFASHFLG